MKGPTQTLCAYKEGRVPDRNQCKDCGVSSKCRGMYALETRVCSVPPSEPLNMEEVDLSNLAEICHLASCLWGGGPLWVQGSHAWEICADGQCTHTWSVSHTWSVTSL